MRLATRNTKGEIVTCTGATLTEEGFWNLVAWVEEPVGLEGVGCDLLVLTISFWKTLDDVWAEPREPFVIRVDGAGSGIPELPKVEGRFLEILSAILWWNVRYQAAKKMPSNDKKRKLWRELYTHSPCQWFTYSSISIFEDLEVVRLIEWPVVQQPYLDWCLLIIRENLLRKIRKHLLDK